MYPYLSPVLPSAHVRSENVLSHLKVLWPFDNIHAISTGIVGVLDFRRHGASRRKYPACYVCAIWTVGIYRWGSARYVLLLSEKKNNSKSNQVNAFATFLCTLQLSNVSKCITQWDTTFWDGTFVVRKTDYWSRPL